MALKERYQNPVIGDQVKLKLFTFNSNNRANVNNIEKVEIYTYDKSLVSELNPEGKRLVTTIIPPNIIEEDVGEYYVLVNITDQLFTIGKYSDAWYVKFVPENDPMIVENIWQVYSSLWISTPLPVVYDFNFVFRPNKVRKGEKKYLIIEIMPNVPRASDLMRYYQNLAIASPLKISIEQLCGDCLPQELDLRLVVDCDPVTIRDKCLGFYHLDTTDMDCGIYNVWFNMEFGDNCYISDKLQLQIY